MQKKINTLVCSECSYFRLTDKTGRGVCTLFPYSPSAYAFRDCAYDFPDPTSSEAPAEASGQKPRS